MIEEGKEYYMSWSDMGGTRAGLYKVLVDKRLNPPNDKFYSVEIIEFYYHFDSDFYRSVTAARSDLFETFKKALESFKKETKMNEQDIIARIFL